VSRPLLFVVVSLSGAAVLALEILGTRILGPFYGVSLYLWSALISVALAALSLGYFLGGAWADRGATPSKLAALLLLAGLWVFAIPLLRDPLLATSETLGLRTAVLVTSTALFFPPLALLGMVSPYAIRLSVRALDEVGRTAGNLYAISTVASVVAALLTGFWLIPHVGVLRLTLGIGFVLCAAAWLAYLGTRRRLLTVAGLALLALVAAVTMRVGAASADRPPADATVLLRTQSPYAEICVLERRGQTYFLIDGGIHSVVDAESGDPRHPYVIVTKLAMDLFEQPGEMLLVGLGGGSAAREFTWGGWQVEAVEIDSVVTRVAKEHFGFRPHHARVVHGDGRRFLQETERGFDLILLDAFGSSSIPFHLVTDEAFAVAKSRLHPGGVLLLNVEAIGWRHPLVLSLGATLRGHFEEVWALPIAEPPDRIGNVILAAADRPLEIPDEVLGSPADFLDNEWAHWESLVRVHAWDNRFELHSGGAQVLTDDLNPVDLWSEEINRVARRELHASFGKSSATGYGWF